MRAILIDPKSQTVSETEIGNSYVHIQRKIDCRAFDCVRLGDDDEHTIYVDDEGLLNGKGYEVGMFRYDGDNPAYLAGRGVILATNSEGESVGAKLTLDYVRSKVAFGSMVRLNGQLVFAELKAGETQVTSKTVNRNRFWAVN